jgi:Exopolysaccharide biosynthesis protein YbjH
VRVQVVGGQGVDNPSGWLMRSAVFAAALGAAFAVQPPLSAAEREDPLATRYSVNDFGGIGLLQTRTARFSPDGEFFIGASFINPYRRYFMTWQIFPFMEVTFRYTDETNRIFFGPTLDQSQGQFFRDIINFRNGNTNLDRSADLKIKLFSEGAIRPALAVGMQDFIGTGLFAGEYLVANKRFGNFDFSFGLGWGHFGSRGWLPNPFRVLGSGFGSRPGFDGKGGQVGTGNFFSGQRASLFGGVEYYSEVDGLSVKLEFDGSEITAPEAISPGFRNLKESIPVNIGVNYQPTSWFDFSVAFERGNSLMIRGALRANFSQPGLTKDPLRDPPVVPREDLQLEHDPLITVALVPERSIILDAVYSELAAANYQVISYTLEYTRANIKLQIQDGNTGKLDPEIVARLVKTLPPNISILNLTVGLANELVQFTIDRVGMEQARAIAQQLDRLTWQSLRVASVTIRSGKMVVAVAGGVEARDSNDLHRLAVNFAATDLDISELRMVNGRGMEISKIYSELRVEHIVDEIYADLGVATSQITALAIVEGDIQFDLDENTSVEDAPYLQLAAAAINVPGADTMSLVDGMSEWGQDGFPHPESEEYVIQRLTNVLAARGFWAYAVDLDGLEATIYLTASVHNEVPRNVARVARLAANYLPRRIEKITVVEIIASFEIYRLSLMRSDLELEARHMRSAEEIWINTTIAEPRGGMSNANQGAVNEQTYPSFGWWLVPELKQHVGDPAEGIYLADLELELGGSVNVTPGLSFTFIGRQFVAGNLDSIKRVSDSVLPHVRSDVVNYLQQGDTTIMAAMGTYMGSAGPNWYYRVSAGILEWMYGGVASEILYRPWGERWALSFELDWAKQRAFNQLFGFRDYAIVTGHATLYYDLPWYGMRAQISAGRYLAGDRGVTIDFSRRFRNGMTVGAFATFTNVSAQDFGEGSFDKGFYLKIPMGLFMPFYSKQSASFMFRPLTRDGGQKLLTGPSLFNLVDRGNFGLINEHWREIGGGQ